MVDQGFYKPHLRLKPFTTIKTKFSNSSGTAESDIKINLNFHICTRAPSKLDFIEALGYLQPFPEEEANPSYKGIPRAWYQFVAKLAAKPCKH